MVPSGRFLCAHGENLGRHVGEPWWPLGSLNFDTFEGPVTHLNFKRCHNFFLLQFFSMKYQVFSYKSWLELLWATGSLVYAVSVVARQIEQFYINVLLLYISKILFTLVFFCAVTCDLIYNTLANSTEHCVLWAVHKMGQTIYNPIAASVVGQ